MHHIDIKLCWLLSFFKGRWCFCFYCFFYWCRNNYLHSCTNKYQTSITRSIKVSNRHFMTSKVEVAQDIHQNREWSFMLVWQLKLIINMKTVIRTLSEVPSSMEYRIYNWALYQSAWNSKSQYNSPLSANNIRNIRKDRLPSWIVFCSYLFT